MEYSKKVLLGMLLLMPVSVWAFGNNFIKLGVDSGFEFELAKIIAPQFTKIMELAHPYQKAVTECIRSTHMMSNCSSGSEGIPAEVTKGVAPIGSLKVMQGVIIIIPNIKPSVPGTEELIYTPTILADGNVQWVISGSSVTYGYADQEDALINAIK